MNLKEAITSAFSSVLSNKMRSILTMLGIIIGISSVILITSLGNGVNKSITDEFNKLGYNGIQIYTSNYGEHKVTEKDKITNADMKVIANHEAIESVTLFANPTAYVNLKNPNEEERVYIFATDSYYDDLRAIELIDGRFIQKGDSKGSKVIVIDETLSKKIFGRTNTLGEKVTAKIDDNEAEFTIIGIQKSEQKNKGIMAMMDGPTSAYIPLETLLDITGEYRDFEFIYKGAKVKPGYEINAVAKEIKKLLGILHNTTPEKYVVSDIMSGVAELSTIFTGITLFISFVAGISLLVGGVGVMNIMLVTVTERTREIGIRKSLGATNWNIQFQFLVEAIILTFIGGIIGIILGYAGSIGAGVIIGIKPIMSIPVIIGVVIISSLIGIIFGVYPANKAAKLDPIDALRYE